MNTFSRKLLTTSAIATTTAVGIYAFLTYRRIACVPTRHITSNNSIPDSFRNSATIQKLVNPGGHVSAEDTRFIDIDIPANHHDVSDEILLANFVRGFYGGHVFGPERTFLSMTRFQLTRVTGIKEAASQIWSTSELSSQSLPPLHSKVFGFQVGNVQLSLKQDAEADQHTESCVDFVFGFNPGWFAGAHRFSISRNTEDREEGADILR